MTVPTKNRAPHDDVHQQMADIVFGCFAGQAIRAFIDLSIAEHLADGPMTADEIARREDSAPDATYRLMRAGLTIGLVTLGAEDRFHGSPLLDTLRNDAPKSVRGLALLMTNPSHWLPWGEFATAVRTGQCTTGHTLGLPLADYLEQNPWMAAEFTEAMANCTTLWVSELVGRLDTNDVKLAIDVGGRNGSLIRMLRQANPELRGIVFDRPEVTAAVQAEVTDDRTEVVGGDFFESLPAGDLYLLKSVLHDWDDESCVKILSRCREAMVSGGRVAIIDFVIGDGDNPGIVVFMDLTMLAMATGRERTLVEFDTLLAKAGLRRIAVQTANSPQRIIEAVAV
jgi:hypothetical protein